MATGNKNESVFFESTSSSTLPLITHDSYFNMLESSDSISTVEKYAKQWAASVSKR